MKSVPYTKLMIIDGVDVKVEFYIHGKHLPATQTDPEEWPELELVSITTSESIYDLLSEKQLDKISDILLKGGD